MYTVNFFCKTIMKHPCVHRFKTAAKAKDYAKQVSAVCKERNIAYQLTIHNKDRVILSGGTTIDEVKEAMKRDEQ